jgi:hypothetical protein
VPFLLLLWRVYSSTIKRHSPLYSIVVSHSHITTYTTKLWQMDGNQTISICTRHSQLAVAPMLSQLELTERVGILSSAAFFCSRAAFFFSSPATSLAALIPSIRSKLSDFNSSLYSISTFKYAGCSYPAIKSIASWNLQCLYSLPLSLPPTLSANIYQKGAFPVAPVAGHYWITLGSNQYY